MTTEGNVDVNEATDYAEKTDVVEDEYDYIAQEF